MGIDPISLAIASTGAQVFGQIQQGAAEKQSAEYNAAIARNNSIIEKQNAQFAAQEGTQNVEKANLTTAAKYGGTLANQGASGVSVGKGSNADVLQSEREIGTLNALTARSNAARAAYGYNSRAQEFEAQSAFDKQQAKRAGIGTLLKVGQTVLGAVPGDAWGSSNSLMYAPNEMPAMGGSSTYNSKAGWIDWK